MSNAGDGKLPGDSVEHDLDPTVDAAEAWKAVGLVNDWVKHAETKAAATLAAAGVMGGVLYNLVKSQTVFDCLMTLTAPLCGLLIVATAGCAIVALWPRLARNESPTSALYFDHIARKHPHSSSDYVKELRALVLAPDELMTQLGQQVWANACVARRKYQAVGWGLVFLFSAGAALALVALDLALRSVMNG
ncbi:Pycsar system effector family protein [Mycobacteroides abscessus]|uniref:Pycsar system effector family protein n=1 Tax=Mycobacteroides abscessus TaxID=36809 RepID=UPI0009A84DEF|nr:Pycsar system effector family protein [Mycobacteroides abscessus]